MKDLFYYQTLKRRAEKWQAEGNTLPSVSENWNGEKTVLTDGHSSDGRHFFRIKTMQHNGWIAVTTYYEDGDVTETCEKGEHNERS